MSTRNRSIFRIPQKATDRDTLQEKFLTKRIIRKIYEEYCDWLINIIEK